MRVKCTYCLAMPGGCSSKKRWSQTCQPLSRLFRLPEAPSLIFSTGLTPSLFNTLLQVLSSETPSLPPFWPALPVLTALCWPWSASTACWFRVVYLLGQIWFSGLPEASSGKHQSREYAPSQPREQKWWLSLPLASGPLASVQGLESSTLLATAWPSWGLSPKPYNLFSEGKRGCFQLYWEAGGRWKQEALGRRTRAGSWGKD